MYPTEPFVRRVVGPYEPELCAIFLKAWRLLSSLPGRSTFDLKRAVATLMHQLVMNEVRTSFAGTSGVHLLEEHETVRLLIGQRLVVRLKKMDRRGYTRAAPTQALLAFTNELPVTLPFGEGLPEVHTVDFGYVLNELETRIDHMLVAARYGDAVIWSYEAERESGAAIAATIAPVAPPSSGTVIKLPVNRKDRKEGEQE